MNITIEQWKKLIPESEVITMSIDSQISDFHTLHQVSIDTRDIDIADAPHTVFFALKGEHVDGNTFISKAFAAGVQICIGTISSEQVKRPSNGVYIQVTDSLKVLQHIAKTYREQYLREVHIIGITGSVGKTTTKDLLTTACKQLVATDTTLSQIYATKGNLNNHIGVPLSILAINPSQKVAILEAGMNHRGEIQVLAEIMQPDTVIITKIGVAHIEYLGSQEEIAREKSDLAIYSSRAAKVFIPTDDAYATFVRSYIEEESSHKCEVILVDTSTSTLLSHTPKHIVDNISLVIACAVYIAEQLNLDIDKNSPKISNETLIKSILASQITPRRFEIKKISNDLLLIDDSYNANPDSMRASLKAFDDLDLSHYFEQDTLIAPHAAIAPQKIAVLGGMAELGTHSQMMHQEITHFVEQLSNIDMVISVGELARQYGFAHGLMYFTDIQGATHALEEILRKNPAPHAIFVKGSKSTHMSDLADILCNLVH